MSNDSSALLQLLTYMDGKDVSIMDIDYLSSYKAICLDKFRLASSFFSCVLSDVAKKNLDDYLSFVSSPQNDFCLEEIGTFGLFISKGLDSFVDATPLQQKFVSMSHPIKVNATLFAQAHFAGYSHKPHIVLSIQCIDDPALQLFEHASDVLGPVLNNASFGAASSKVVSGEGAMVSIENPDDMVMAIKEGASLVRKHGKNSNNEFLESFTVEFVITENCSNEAILEIVHSTLLSFHCVASSLIKHFD